MKNYLLTVFLLGFLGCTNHVDPAKLIGKYFISNDSLESITIANNHTYKHVIRTSNGDFFENNGTWKYDSRTKQISFDYFLFTTDQPAGTWVSRVKVTSKGEIQLIYSSEEDLYYSKK